MKAAAGRINDINAGSIVNNKKCWIRYIKVVLTSRKVKRSMVFDNFTPKKMFNISIKGSKYVATNKDNGTVTITNLEYDTMMQIILDEYYDIEIYAGYKSLLNNDDYSLPRFFKGQVSFINQKIHSRHDQDTYIHFASELVARYSQSRMNFSFNSGFNIYGAMNYMCQLSGIGNRANISPKLKLAFLKRMYTNYSTNQTVFDNLAEIGGNYMINTDGSEDGSVINITDLSNKRKITIDPDTINLQKGNPTITSSGLKLSLLPTMNFRPGDIIKIDNGLIDSSITNSEQVKETFNTNFLDQNGEYMILQVDGAFQNRGKTFELNITARAMHIIQNMQLS